MKAATLTALLVATVTVGCSSTPALREMSGVRDEARWAGLALAMEVPNSQVSPAEPIPVYLRLTNLTASPIAIESSSDQKVILSVFAPTPVGWKKLKDYYPATPLQTPTTWTLPPGSTQIIEMPLTVEADWPTNSDVRLTAQVNGRPDLRTTVQVFILPVTAVTP